MAQSFTPTPRTARTSPTSRSHASFWSRPRRQTVPRMSALGRRVVMSYHPSFVSAVIAAKRLAVARRLLATAVHGRKQASRSALHRCPHRMEPRKPGSALGWRSLLLLTSIRAATEVRQAEASTGAPNRHRLAPRFQNASIPRHGMGLGALAASLPRSSKPRVYMVFEATERAGFEPAMEFDPHTRLAGECLQPLGHLSWRSGQFRGCRQLRACAAHRR
jgi:hypothetical protein